MNLYLPIFLLHNRNQTLPLVKQGVFSLDASFGSKIPRQPMKTVRLLSFFSILLVSLLALCTYGIALAQEGEEPQPELISEPEETKPREWIAVNPTYPEIESVAGGDFEFEVQFTYVGMDARIFDLRTTAPTGWDVYMTPPYEKEKKISSIRLQPTISAPEKIRLVATAPFWPLPDPGKYKITLEAIAEDIENSAELTAVITAKYVLNIFPETEQYNTVARAGEDNFFAIRTQNLSSAAVDNIKFSSTHPDGWTIEFKPDKIDVMEAISDQTIEVNIKPPSKAIAGDYIINLKAAGKQISAKDIDVRITVETPTIWGWVGVIIILIVVIGLIAVFMRFSRR